jgi:hypothetical protein
MTQRTEGRFLLVADPQEGVWLVIDTKRCVVLHPRPGDACASPEELVPGSQEQVVRPYVLPVVNPVVTEGLLPMHYIPKPENLG